MNCTETLCRYFFWGPPVDVQVCASVRALVESHHPTVVQRVCSAFDRVRNLDHFCKTLCDNPPAGYEEEATVICHTWSKASAILQNRAINVARMDLFKICIVGSILLQGQFSSYKLKKKVSQLAYTLLIDAGRQTVAIDQKKQLSMDKKNLSYGIELQLPQTGSAFGWQKVVEKKKVSEQEMCLTKQYGTFLSGVCVSEVPMKLFSFTMPAFEGSWRDISLSSDRDTLLVLFDVLERLARMHQDGVVHSDIKEENILVSRTGSRVRGYLCDFGLSRSVNRQQEMTLMHYGTPLMTAPELWKRTTADGGTTVGEWKGYDLFALGCVIYTCLSPNKSDGPFRYESMEKLYKVKKPAIETGTFLRSFALQMEVEGLDFQNDLAQSRAELEEIVSTTPASTERHMLAYLGMRMLAESRGRISAADALSCLSRFLRLESSSSAGSTVSQIANPF